MPEEDDKPKRGSGDEEEEPCIATEETIIQAEGQESQVEEQEGQDRGGKGVDTQNRECTAREPVADVGHCEVGATAEIDSKQEESSLDSPVLVVSGCAENPDQDVSVADTEVEEEGLQIQSECKVRRVSVSAVNWAVETDHLYSKPLLEDIPKESKDVVEQEEDQDLGDQEKGKDFTDQEEEQHLLEQEQDKNLIDKEEDKDLVDQKEGNLHLVDQEEGKDLIDQEEEKDLVNQEENTDLVNQEEDKDLVEKREAKDPVSQEEDKDLVYQEEGKDLIYQERDKGLVHQGEEKDLDNQEGKDLVHQEEVKDLANQEGKDSVHQEEEKELANQEGKDLVHQEEKDLANQEGKDFPVHQEEEKDLANQEGKDIPVHQEEEKELANQEGKDIVDQEEKKDLATQQNKDIADQEEEKNLVNQERERDLAHQVGKELFDQEKYKGLVEQKEGKELVDQEEDKKLVDQEEDKELVKHEIDKEFTDQEDKEFVDQKEDKDLTSQKNIESLDQKNKELVHQKEDKELVEQGEDKKLIDQGGNKDLVGQGEDNELDDQREKNELTDVKVNVSPSQTAEDVMAKKTEMMEKEVVDAVNEHVEPHTSSQDTVQDVNECPEVEQTKSTAMAPPETCTDIGSQEDGKFSYKDADAGALHVKGYGVFVDSKTVDTDVNNETDTEAKPGEHDVAEEEGVDSDAKSNLIIDTDTTKGEETTDEQQREVEEECGKVEQEDTVHTDGVADGEGNEHVQSEKSLLSIEQMEAGGAREPHAVNYEVESKDLNGPDVTEARPEEQAEEEFDINSSISDSANLPQCRLKRNYCCMHCGINTQNPREYLYHLRDDHGEKMKVFECPRCIYASKNHQKLIRHARMVHKLKIKRLEASTTSPYKSQIKSPVSNFSSMKSARASVSPSKSTRSSPGRSPRHTEYPPDTWEEVVDEDAQLDQEESQVKGDDKKVLSCEHCEYSCTSRKLLNRHETSYHLKRRFFRCLKCNYVTHLKGRYTKHMKYHQLPILKCDYCDFRTPYRWNLDRHLKNHTEDCGEYKCHMCNFTAQIKQSLTVHISNHHLTPEQIREKELRRTIGISDPADCTSDDQELEMLRLERDEHPDALLLPGFSAPSSPTSTDTSQSQVNGSNSFRVSNIDVGSQDDSQMCAEDEGDEDGEPKKKKPKIKITLTKMKTSKPKDTFFQELNERHNFEEDFIHPDDVVHRHGNVYIKTFKCRFCPFKAAFKNEVSRHEKKIHSIPLPKPENISRKAKKTVKSKLARHSFSTASDDVISQILQYPRTDGYIAPSESSVLDVEGEPSGKLNPKVEASNEETYDNAQDGANFTIDHEASPESLHQCATTKESSPSKDTCKKKNPSFFDKLQEKMPTSNVQNLVCQFCGHESKCLSESVRHQKLHLSAKNIYASASLSTRCQFCRHRCKTTDDLMHHLKLCPEARKNQITDSGRRPSGTRTDENEDSMSSGRGDNMDEEEEENDDNDSKGDCRDETAVEDNTPLLEGEAHPMENRVFVWNNFEKEQVDDQNSLDMKDQNEQEEKEAVGKWQRRDSTDSLKKSSGRSDSKSPVSFEGQLDYIESPVPQGQHYYSKRVYRCPQCSFWATTASRFHVHIVGHFNRKPYNCSECGYKSNWRWDITKHIKLKTSRDSSHANAQVIITDETGEKNYEKYDCYLSIIQLDETNAHRTEGGIPTRKGRPKRTPEKEEGGVEETTPTASPLRKPPMVAIPVMPRLQNLPRLTRAPARLPTSQPGPMPFGPILRGAQMMVQFAGSRAAVSAVSASASPSPTPSPSLSAAAAAGNIINTRPPPPLTLRGAPRVGTSPATSKVETERESPPVPPGQYEIITSQRPCENLLVLKSLVVKQCSDRMVLQGSVNTSLETLQLLASGSTNLSKLKKQPKGSLADAQDKDSQAPVSHQVSVSSTGEDGKEVARMVLDHEGNPEWKCNSCDFRDSERETVFHHVRLAHTRNGPVSLLHAVHRCDLCGYAAGTKRAVQMHIDTSHGGQGGITSRCEGQNPETKDSGEGEADSEAGRSYRCRLCPFTCSKRSQMRPHLMYHVARPDCIFKCMFCPYYVPTKGELFEHLSLHDDCPWAVLDQASLNRSNSSSPGPSNQDDGGPRQFVCGLCPYESRSRSKLMHHRQFHKPKGLPFRCPHCSYNVTRRHLLSQHIRVHGIVDGAEGTGASDVMGQVDERSNSPSPSLTITPVTNAATTGDTGEDTALSDSAQLPKLLDESTVHMEDIPLVWVSRDRRFFKMFKCRHCPHVNLRKTNIQEHEKMHKTNISKEAGGLHCPYCSYVSVNAGVMSAHLKVHGGSMGQCHAVVDPSLSDEDQLKQLTSRASNPSSELSQSLSTVDDTKSSRTDEKVLYYCQHCPARFFLEKEIQIHTRFHTANLPLTCDHCSYGARQSAHLLTHLKVHTPEYQQRTRTMMGQHRTASSYPPVPGVHIPFIDLAREKTLQTSDRGSNQQTFIGSPTPSAVLPQPPPTSKYMCDECPASFSKQVTLQYHQSLHGAKNPHQCPRCSYAGKTEDSLQQHIQLHTQHDQNYQAEKSAKEASKKMEVQKALEATIKSKLYSKNNERDSKSGYPPIKLKLIGLRPGTSNSVEDGSRPQFKYYIEEQVPLSGVDLLRRKTQLEKEGGEKTYDASSNSKMQTFGKHKVQKEQRDKEDMEEDDPKRIGNPNLHYPMHIDKVTGKSREKRYKCKKCPSAFEKVEQYNVHSNLHGSHHKYKCRICDYSVKFYANFMMHINRHKYHERMASQKGGSPPPVDSDPKYEPIISTDTSHIEKVRNREESSVNKENLEEADLTTIERQHLLLQNKKGVADSSKKDEERERRVYYCQYCPYANVRRDAVDSHSLRHHANGGYGSYRCTFCDYTASQPNFIREHTKVHFRPFKYVTPEGFMRHDRQELISTPCMVGGKTGGGSNIDGGGQPSPEKYTVFAHEMGNIKPIQSSKEDNDDHCDPPAAKRIKVNFHSGDIVDAPNDFVISLRPSRSKAAQYHVEPTEMVVSEPGTSSAKLHGNVMSDMDTQNCEHQIPSHTENKKPQDNVMATEDTEKMADENKEEIHAPLVSTDSCFNEDKMELDSSNKERLENQELSMTNGHHEDEPQEPTFEEPIDVDNENKIGSDNSSSNVLDVPQPLEKNCEKHQPQEMDSN